MTAYTTIEPSMLTVDKKGIYNETSGNLEDVELANTMGIGAMFNGFLVKGRKTHYNSNIA